MRIRSTPAEWYMPQSDAVSAICEPLPATSRDRSPRRNDRFVPPSIRCRDSSVSVVDSRWARRPSHESAARLMLYNRKAGLFAISGRNLDGRRCPFRWRSTMVPLCQRLTRGGGQHPFEILGPGHHEFRRVPRAASRRAPGC
jgi:hypothetical protein